MTKRTDKDNIQVRNELALAFGQHIKKLRLGKGYSMRGFADKADMEYTQIARIEHGISAPTITTIYKLAEALDIQMKELFDFKFPVKSKK